MSGTRVLVVAAAALFAFAGSVSAEDAPPPAAAPADWGQALAEDAKAFRDMIADSHPGPVDRENPGFNALLESSFQAALARAKTADSYEDWYFALQAFAASFDDGHLSLSGYAPMGHVWRAEWPGFLTGLRDGRHTVVFSRDPAAPPIGAVLRSCDGTGADAFAADFVGLGAGRWKLASRRAAYAATLFVDQKNPYVTRPSVCAFEIEGGGTRDYRLVWRDLPDAVRDEGFAAARSPRFTAPIELRPVEGGYWLGLGSFNSDVSSGEGRELAALQTEVEAAAPAIREAGIVVFDLRGNNGGSSSWINGLVRAIWGKDWVDAKQPSSEQVEWRPSQANIDQIVGYHALLGDDPEIKRWLDLIEAGMRDARAKGQPLWLQTDDGDGKPAVPAVAPTTAMKARVYVLTDYGCASACLDAVDVLKALDAVQVGQETSGDTVYMEVRYAPLPSGRVKAGVPMKVYRGRARGNNETAVPAHAWTGALGDTAGLEAWIRSIDAKR